MPDIEKLVIGLPALYETGVPDKPVSKAEKQKYWSQPVTDEVRQEIGDLVDNFLQSVTHTDIQEKRLVTADEADSLMLEKQAIDDLRILLDARDARIKQMAFNHIEADAREKGREDPRNSPGALVSPSTGKAFKREGGGTEEPTIDLPKLKSLVTPEVWKKISTKTKIPAKVIEDIDHNKLDDLIQKNPNLIDTVRQSLVEGGRKAAKFIVRDIK